MSFEKRSIDELPPLPGVGLKPEHLEAILSAPQPVGFFEVHAENYMGAGGPPHRALQAIRDRYPLSIHGVGLSIGGALPLDAAHLSRLKSLIDRYEPAQFSEHLAWSTHQDPEGQPEFLNDLLPLPYTGETLAQVAAHVEQAQETLKQRMLLENPATYVLFEDSTWSETDFLEEVARRTGCGLLLDVNNVFVSAANHGFDPRAYLTAFPLHRVGEIHLAGHAGSQEEEEEGLLLIDSHNSPVADPVWALYREVIARVGPVATLIEWDNDVPDWGTLLAEALRAGSLLRESARVHGAAAA